MGRQAAMYLAIMLSGTERRGSAFMQFSRVAVMLFSLIVCHSYAIYAQQAVISTVISLPPEQANAYPPNENYDLIMQATHVSIRNPYNSIPMMLHVIDKSLYEQDYDNVFQGYFSLGAILTSTGDYTGAHEAYRKAMFFSYKTQAPTANLCRALNNIGNTYIFQCDYRHASQYYFKAAQLATQHNGKTDVHISDQLVRIYNNLGAALLQLNQFNKAIYYLDKAEILSKNLQAGERFSIVYGNKAAVYNKLNMTDSARHYGQQALDFARYYGKFHDEFSALTNLAMVMISTGRPHVAIRYLDTAFRIQGNIFPYYKTEARYLYGQAYFMLGNYEKAKSFFLAGEKIARQTHATDYLLRIHQQLAMLYANGKNYKQAFHHMQLAYALNDSTLNKEKTETVNLLEVKYRTAEKDKELAQKQLQIKNQEQRLEQKNLWITATTGGSLVLILLLVALHKHNQHKQRLQANQIHILQQQQELLQKEQEINTLKAMMLGEEQERTRISQDLHDGVGSTLAAVKMNFTAIRNDHPALNMDATFNEALNRLDDMYHELRQAAHNLTPEFLLQHGLADAIGLYCEQISKGKSLEIIFRSYGSRNGLKGEFVLNVYRIIQELIHNIIKHAQATKALVQLYQHDHLLSVNIEDNGSGFDPETDKGIGFTNIQRRLKNTGGNMNIESSENGTSIFLEFDLEVVIRSLQGNTVT